MTYLDKEIELLLDQVADYADGYPNVLDMVAQAEADAKTNHQEKVLLDYLRQLVTRLAILPSQHNSIVYYRESKDKPGFFQIRNYDYKMYCWYLNRGLPKETVTARTLNIDTKLLTKEERESFMKRVIRTY